MNQEASSASVAQHRVITSGSWAVAAFSWIYFLAMRASRPALLLIALQIIPVVFSWMAILGVGRAFRGGLALVANVAGWGGFGLWIYYIVIGKRIAWTTRTWSGFDDFLACQRIWDRWAKWVLFLIVPLLFIVAVIIGYSAIGLF